MSDDHSPLPAFPSIRPCYINLCPFQSVFGSDLHKHKIVCFLKESNMDQNFYQGVKNISRQDVRINIIQIIGRLFT